ncbi:hypothetical protein [Collimonas fungivorans]|uniref:hypothetical protein n=1 Tax=Collimonas fungivorans TaxID=158899 RepID=UPI000A52D90F|nr:hypothetical protein [Collimonas fungivorans]
MALCISVFERLDLQVLRNHQHYCTLFGYPHRWVETAHIAHPMLRQAYRYHLLLQELRQAADNDWVLLLDCNAVIVHPLAMETLLAGRDALLVKAPPAAVGRTAGRHEQYAGVAQYRGKPQDPARHRFYLAQSPDPG